MGSSSGHVRDWVKRMGRGQLRMPRKGAEGREGEKEGRI